VRIAVFSDVHGNAIALDACLARVDRLGVDARIFLGDVVGYLPGEVECLRALRDAGFACQKGNHEAMLLSGSATGELEAVYRLGDARRRLAGEALEAIAAWPVTRTLERDGVRLLFVHGAPHDPLHGYVYPDSDLAGWEGLPFDAVFMGHTHRPFARRRGRVLVANAGSVGLPRDVGGLASFAVFDSQTRACRHVRVPFDAAEVARRVGPALHPATRACLRRRAARVVGEVVA
jgi:predicted phosphodiesterase